MPCDEKDHVCPLKEVKRTKIPAITEHIHYDAQGNARFVELHGYPVFDEKDNVIQMIEYCVDITKQKQSQEEKANLETRLRQAHKMEAIGTLAGGIAHDFNNILGGVLGYADMAKDEVPVGSSAYNDLKNVLKAGYKAKELVKQILTFSRQAEVERIPLHPQSIIKEAAKLLRSSIPTTIEIHQDIDPKCGVVLADPTQVHQILMNLCTNAYHAMEETGGKLEITLKNTELKTEDFQHEPDFEPGSYVELMVRDTGNGMPQEIRNRIFDPYFTTKETRKGTGMGLAIVHGIVKSYGGVIRVESEPGKGTTFQIFFPVVEKDVEAEPESQEQIPTGKERVLFIDDEPLLADMGKAMLERLGYTVTVRKSSLEALEAFRAQPDKFDIVITDQTMPEMTGAHMAKEILLIRSDIPIILCTGYSTSISEKKAKEIGIKEFALKPLIKKDIAILIRKVLGDV